MVVEKPDYRHRHLLPTRGDWPRHRRTTQKRDEIAPFQPIILDSPSSQAGAGMQDIGSARLGQRVLQCFATNQRA
jgi:hypothetical protein